jgi:hypothetical protein
MKEILNQLIKLQEIDSRLYEINELKGDLPSKVESQVLELETYQTENSQKTQRIEEITQECRKFNAEVEGFNHKLKKYQDQIYLVTSNKEYDALNAEIDHMKKSISSSETTILELEEEKTQLEELIKSNENKIEQVTESLESDKDELSSALSQTESEEKALKTSRETMTSEIDRRYLSSYERIKGARDGVGMVSILRGACGSCYSKLPPQTAIEIKENATIVTCPSCSVFLFWDGAED